MGTIDYLIKKGILSIEDIAKTDLDKIMERMQKAEKLMRVWDRVVLFPIGKNEARFRIDPEDDQSYYLYIFKDGEVRVGRIGDSVPVPNPSVDYKWNMNLNNFGFCFNLLDNRDEEKVFDSLLEKAEN